MAKLKLLVLHCLATPEGMEVTKKMIEDWHIRGRGWSRVGYCDFIHLDGSLENLIPFNQDDYIDRFEISNGARGLNSKARHIAYVGGCANVKKRKDKYYPPKDTRTPEQLETLELYVKFQIKRHPHIKVGGHNQFANKACPSFDVPTWLREIGIKEENIYVG